MATLCFGILSGYWIIAKDWHRLEQLTENPHGKEALRSLRNIFILCGICGYGMVIVRSLVPAWCPTVILMIFLNWVTWRYISQLKGLAEIHRDAATLDELKRESRKNIENETPLETAARCKRLLDEHLERIDRDA